MYRVITSYSGQIFESLNTLICIEKAKEAVINGEAWAQVLDKENNIIFTEYEKKYNARIDDDDKFANYS